MRWITAVRRGSQHMMAGLRLRSTGLLAAAAVATLILLSAVMLYAFIRSAAVADALDRSDKQKLAAHYLDQSTSTVINQQKAQVTWDEGFVAAGLTLDTDWADQNLGGYLWNEFALDHNFLVTPDGELLRGWTRGKQAPLAKFDPLKGKIKRIMATLPSNRHVLGTAASLKPLDDTVWPVDETGRPLSRWYGEQIEFDGKPALLTVLSLLPDASHNLLTRSPNHLVSVRYIDARFLNEMSDALLLKQLHFRREPSSNDALNNIPVVPNEGSHAGYLVWNAGRPGDTIFEATLPLLVVVVLYCLVLLVVGAIALRRLLAASRELAVREAQAKHVSMHDHMSNLPNRAHFQRRLSEQLESITDVPDDRVVLVAFIDLDRFKDVNDTLGHKAGDDLIKVVAKRLRRGLPESDFLSRLGGDEFVVMRVTRRHPSAMRKLGCQITRILSKPAYVLGQELRIGASIGISTGPDHGTDPGELLRHADIALYQAKQLGRGRWCAFTPAMDEHVQARREIELELRKAISEERFDIAYQPIISARSEKMVSVEALLRWDIPGKGMISPGFFVPIAEQTGQMVQLGLWILRRVFQDHQAWPGLGLSVNLSPVQIVSNTFMNNLRTIVAETGVNPRRVTFEITEGVLLDRTDQVLEVLSDLRDMGFRIALDDFGTGYSSLAYLRSFRFDKIKIDQSFVQNIENDLDALKILKAVVALGKSLQMDVVAEGVETLLQRQLVVAAGCQEIQGYFYSRPVSRAEISKRLETSIRSQTIGLARAA